MSKQTTNGRGFEYAVLTEVERAVSALATIRVQDDENLSQVRMAFLACDPSDRSIMQSAGRRFAEFLLAAEPRFTGSSSTVPLEILRQGDKRGEEGDVRDILCTGSNPSWEVGISAKHNHKALKNSRLSRTLDFGSKWMGIPCSKRYYEAISGTFDYLDEHAKAEVLWRDVPRKYDQVYLPLMVAFIQEFRRIHSEHPSAAGQLLTYLLGGKDLYRVALLLKPNRVEIDGVNLHGTLNLPHRNFRPSLKVPKVDLTGALQGIDWKDGSKTTAVARFTSDWAVTLRIHSAKSRVEPSLKFDVQLLGQPGKLFRQSIPL